MKYRVLAYAVAMLSACGGDLAHDAPFDDQSPASLQAPAALTGRLTLEGEADYSQVSVQLQNDDRSYTGLTHADGSVELTGIVPGTYTLTTGTRYFEETSEPVTLRLHQRFDLGTRRLAAKRAAVTGKAVLQDALGVPHGGVTVVLTRVGSLRGTAASAPAAWNALATPVTETPSLQFSGTSQSDGTYHFDGVPSGIYEVSALSTQASTRVQHVMVTGEDGTVTVQDVVLLPMIGSVEIVGKNGANAVSTSTASLRLNCTGNPSVAQLAFDPAFVTALPPFSFRTLTTVALPAGDGAKSIYVRYYNDLGDVSSVGGDTVTLDTTPPQLATLTIENASPTNADPLNLAYSALDAVSFRLTEGAVCGGAEQPYGNGHAIWTLIDALEGVKAIAVQFFDAVHNPSACVSAQVYYDPNAPVLLANPFVIAGGAGVVSSNTVELAFNVTGATRLKVSEDASFSGAAWQPYSATRTFLLSAGDGTKWLYAVAADDAGNVVGPFSADVILDRTPPQLLSNPVVLQGCCDYTQGTFTVSEALRVALNATGWSLATVYDDLSFTNPLAVLDALLPPAPVDFNLSLGNRYDGLKSIYVSVADAAGNTALAQASILLDATPPAFPSVAMASGTTITTTPVISLGLMAIDDGSGLQGVTLAEDSAFTSNAVSAVFTPTLAYTLSSSASGNYRVYAKFTDRAGNTSGAVNVPVLLDNQDPVVSSVILNTGDLLTNNTLVGVDVAASDDNQVTAMQLSEDAAFAGAAWIDYQPHVLYTLSALQGAKTLYSRVRDRAGRISNAASSGIALDTLPPSNLGVWLDGGALITSSTLVTATLAAADMNAIEMAIDGDVVSVDSVSANVGQWLPLETAPLLALSAGDGPKLVNVRFRDVARNEAPAFAATILVDTAAPPEPSINAAAGGHHSVTVTWQGGADAVAYDVSYRFEGAGIPGTGALEGPSPVRVFGASQYTLTLHNLPNLRNFEVAVRSVDSAGNTSAYTPALVAGTGRQVVNVQQGLGEIAALGSSGGALFDALAAGNVIKFLHSSDGGQTWNLETEIDTGGAVLYLAAKGTESGSAYVAAVTQTSNLSYFFLTVFRSRDAGHTWAGTRVSQVIGYQYPSIDAVGTDQVFTCLRDDGLSYGLQYSNDGGRTFQRSAVVRGSPNAYCSVSASAESVTVFFDYYDAGYKGAAQEFFVAGPTLVKRSEALLPPFTDAFGYVRIARTRDGAIWAYNRMGSLLEYRNGAWSNANAAPVLHFVAQSWDPVLLDRFAIDANDNFVVNDVDRIWTANVTDIRTTGQWKAVSLGIGANQRLRGAPAFLGQAPYVAVFDSSFNLAQLSAPIVPPPNLDAYLVDNVFGFAWPSVPGTIDNMIYWGGTTYATTNSQRLASLSSGSVSQTPSTTTWFSATVGTAEGPSELSPARGLAAFSPYTAMPYYWSWSQALALQRGSQTILSPLQWSVGPLHWSPDRGVTWIDGEWTIPGSVGAAAPSGMIYTCEVQWTGSYVMQLYRLDSIGRAAEPVTSLTSAAGSCVLAADGLGHVAVATYEGGSWFGTNVLVRQSSDFGKHFTTLWTSAPGVYTTLPGMQLAYDPLGSLWLLVNPNGSTNTDWIYLPNNVAGRGATPKSGVLTGVTLPSAMSYSNAVKFVIDARGYAHLFNGSYLRSTATDSFDAPIRLALPAGITPLGILFGDQDDVYLQYRDVSQNLTLKRSLNGGETFLDAEQFQLGFYDDGVLGFIDGGLFQLDTYRDGITPGRTRWGAKVLRNDGFAPVPAQSGLTGYYFDGPDFDTLHDVRIDALVDFAWPGAPLPGMGTAGYSVRWLGASYFEYDEPYAVAVTAVDGVRLWIDGVSVIDDWSVTPSPTERTGVWSATRGWHRIRLDTTNVSGNGAVHLLFASASQPRVAMPYLTRFANKPFDDVRSGPLYLANSEASVTEATPFPAAVSITAGDTDDGYAAIDLPFSFPFARQLTARVNIGTNGFLTFGTGAGQTSPATAVFPNNAPTDAGKVAVFAQDLQASDAADAQINWEVVGTAPWRRAVITWHNWARKGQPSDRLEFQAILYETSGEIEMRFGAIAGVPVVGINVGNGIEGSQAAAGLVGNGLSWRYVPNPDWFFMPH